MYSSNIYVILKKKSFFYFLSCTYTFFSLRKAEWWKCNNKLVGPVRGLFDLKSTISREIAASFTGSLYCAFFIW